MKIETLKDEVGEHLMGQMTADLSFAPAHWYGLASDHFQNVEIIPIIMSHGIRCTICPNRRYHQDQDPKPGYDAYLITDKEVPDDVMVIIKLTY